MQITTFNVNGLKAILKRKDCSLSCFLKSLDSDIICLQETKVTRSQLIEDIAIAEGYEGFFSFCAVKEGYSGVVTFVRRSHLPVAAEATLLSRAGAEEGSLLCGGLAAEQCAAGSDVDREGRAVVTEHPLDGGASLVVVNVYCPHVDETRPERMAFKLAFFEALEQRCKALHRAGKLVVVVGDVNCSYNPVDSAYALDEPLLQSTFSENPSRQWLKSFVSDKFPAPSMPVAAAGGWCVVDAFRALHPAIAQAYTCWSTVTGARATNYGTRIDYILVDPALQSLLTDCCIQPEVRGSDHCPVTAVLSTCVKPAAAAPTLAATHFPEFAGKQSSLKHFFAKQELPVKRSSTQLNPPPKLPRQSSLKTFFGKQVPPPKRPSKAQLTLPLAKLSTVPAVTEHQSGGLPMPDDVPLATTTGEGWSSTGSVQPVTDTSAAGSQPTTRAVLKDWKEVLKGLPPPPLCRGHGEKAVLRTVKKDGPNKNRQFYVCARPAGAKNNPAARCDFFQWLQKS